MDERDWKRILQKVADEGFEGRGKVERFMEKIARERVIFIRGEGKIEIFVK